jgi:uncharacterized membrane protein YtjA (UPF0391 family)
VVRRQREEEFQLPAAGHEWKGMFMLGWAVVFLVIALIAGFLGFTGVAGTAVGIAKILFVVFLVLFLVSLVFGRRGRPM